MSLRMFLNLSSVAASVKEEEVCSEADPFVCDDVLDPSVESFSKSAASSSALMEPS